MADGGSEATRLDARVVSVEATAGGEADREVVVQRIDRWRPLHHRERCGGTLHGVVPKPCVEERRAWMLVVGTRPLDAPELLEASVEDGMQDLKLRLEEFVATCHLAIEAARTGHPEHVQQASSW